MTVPANTNTLLLNSAAPAAYQISRSLRFNRDDSTNLSRSVGSASNRRTFTFSCWLKRSGIDSSRRYILFSTYSSGSVYFTLEFETNRLEVFDGGSISSGLLTAAVFRDPSAWYHIVLSVDTTQATASNRVKLYINGTEQTLSGTQPAQNADLNINTAVTHRIGALDAGGILHALDGYLADIYFLDGTATTPSTFAETDAITGQWVPKTPTGISYGTNGFRLTFSDNSGTTSTTLGKDAAGSNNWTPNNFSVASGSGNDSLVDSPTSYGTDTGAGGEVRGNYCVCNPLLAKSNETYSNGNLDVSVGATGPGRIWGTIGVSSGKWYFEYTQTSGTYAQAVGIKSNFVTNDLVNNYLYIGYDGTKLNASGGTSSYGATWGNNDVIGVAFDLDAGTITFYKNGTSQGQAFSGITAATYFPHVMQYAGGSFGFTINFGQRAFAYTAPSGFKALCDTNLTAPTIAKPANYFDVLLWSGTGGNRSFSSLNMSPDFVWIKQRNQAYSTGHQLYDIVRGAGSEKELNSSGTGAEGAGNIDQYGWLSSFDSNGFSVTAGPLGAEYVNGSGVTYAAWCWDGGSSNSTNTSGTITSTVRASATSGFSVVAYTGNLSSPGVSTVGHGLGVAPSMVITKRRDGASNWCVQHISTSSASQILFLDTTDSQYNTSGNGTLSRPTSTVFSINNSTGLGVNGQTHVAYCFAPVAGYSAFGSYTGNGSTDGPFVFCGFRPRYLMVKASSTGGSYYYWYVFDSVRDTANPTDLMLFPNVSDAESSTYDFDFLANGFKVRTNAIYVNNSAVTYIYAAFAENPFQYARAK